MANRSNKQQGRIPVANRERQARAAQRKAAASRTQQLENARSTFRIGPQQLAIVAVIVIISLTVIAIPLKNFFVQRGQIARYSASIEAKSNHVAELEEQLARYQDEDYIREQARVRLGLIEPGETAFRIIDPAMSADQEKNRTTRETTVNHPWYETVWKSITTPDSELVVPLSPAEPEPPAPGTEQPAPGPDQPAPAPDQEQPHQLPNGEQPAPVPPAEEAPQPAAVPAPTG